MQSIPTKLTQLLSAYLRFVLCALLICDTVDVQSPILAAPMAFASTADLAAAVTGKGGYGFIGAGTFCTSHSAGRSLIPLPKASILLSNSGQLCALRARP